MNELAVILERQAARILPVANLDDVYRRADRRRRRLRTGRVTATVLTIAATIAIVVAVTEPGSNGDKFTGTLAGVQTSSQQPLGLVIAGAGADVSYHRRTLDRSDPDAATGPFAVVVRRVDGRLGTASAVVTSPVPAGTGNDGNVHANTSSGNNLLTLVASRPGGSVLVRGANMAATEITAIADVTSVVDGRPVVSLPESMVKYSVVATGTVRPPVVSEARYGCDAVGEGSTLGGLCYTGLATSPGFENALYENGFESGPIVQGHVSVVSTVGGGSATLAWEPEPGIIVYVGYSGASLGRQQIDALGRLAERATFITAAEWAATQPQVVTQTNSW